MGYEHTKRWREQHPEAFRAEQARRRQRVKARTRDHIRAAKQRPCADCGIEYPWYVMQFDHAHGEKLRNVSTMASSTWGLTRIIAEIAKCDVVCANCHAIRTYQRQEGPHRVR